MHVCLSPRKNKSGKSWSAKVEERLESGQRHNKKDPAPGPGRGRGLLGAGRRGFVPALPENGLVGWGSTRSSPEGCKGSGRHPALVPFVLPGLFYYGFLMGWERFCEGLRILSRDHRDELGSPGGGILLSPWPKKGF